MHHRQSGILLHPSSLPGPEAIGTLGQSARQFVDFLARSGQSLWQVLPLGPPACGNSPYSCFSAFAGNPDLIDLQQLCDEGDLLPTELPGQPPTSQVDFTAVREEKGPQLKAAAARFFAGSVQDRMPEFWRFCDSTFWLDDFALFMACKEYFHGVPWHRWPKDLVQRKPAAITSYRAELGALIGEQKYLQWQFSRQWHAVKGYANSKGVRIIGDAPIFVAHDSADVWCNQHLFMLDATGKPTLVAGVPPDYFSKTGQLWGNPLYRWDRLQADGYGWWLARLRNDFSLYDLVRIDHFRGFEAFWEVSGGQKTAIRGRWVQGPGADFFIAARTNLGELPIIAEDLGVITPAVEQLRDSFGFPGMNILQFAFDSGAGNAYLPHNHRHNSVVYTGTHDNNTTRGWFAQLTVKQQHRVCDYLRCSTEDLVWEMIRAAQASVSHMAILPLQDLLDLDANARMNCPGVATGNWGWRYLPGSLTETLASRLHHLAHLYDRLPH